MPTSAFDPVAPRFSARDVEALAQKLVAFDTINPPGMEDDCARYLGSLLQARGFDVRYHSFAPGRASIVADIGPHEGRPPICFTGHLDTVPLGSAPWRQDPFGGRIVDGRLYGRGASDMKGAIAAMVAAAVDVSEALRKAKAGLKLVFTAGEETGCEGARHLASTDALGQAGAVIVGEPTENEPVLGHKGALWLRASARGKTAHGSMPQLGVNAIFKLASPLTRLEGLQPGTAQHATMGRSTLNVGTFRAGKNVNSVPDEAIAEIDVRLVPGDVAGQVVRRICECLGADVQVDTILNVEDLLSEARHPWVKRVYELIQHFHAQPLRQRTVTFFSDGPALARAFGGAPVVILGPGESAQAHQTDEFCFVRNIHDAREMYRRIAMDWCAAAAKEPEELP